MALRKNKNRGYQKLRVWQDAIELYWLTYATLKKWPYDLSKIKRDTISSVDSVHRNIAEGYCRRSINEYVNFLNIAQGSLGESVSAFHAYARAEHLSNEDFEKLDALSYKLENGMLRLIESLEHKREQGNWVDYLMVKESNAVYKTE